MLVFDKKPFPWERLKETEVIEHRMLDCPLYKECLTKAAVLHWKGWTCLFCSNHKKEVEKND